MKTVKAATFQKKCREGEWECVFEPNRFGTAEVRSTRTGKRFTIKVEG